MALCCREADSLLVLGEYMGLCVCVHVCLCNDTDMHTVCVVGRLAPRCHKGIALCDCGVASLPVSCYIWGSAPHNPSGQDAIITAFYCNCM